MKLTKQILKWFILVSLIVAVIVLAIFYNQATADGAVNKNALENVYQNSYFDTVQTINDMEIKLAKIDYSTNNDTKKKYLYDIWKGAESVSNNLSNLTTEEGNHTKFYRFINQLGDYSYFLAQKLEKNKNLESKEIETIEKVHECVVKVGKELSKMRAEIEKGYLFTGKINVECLQNLVNSLNDTSVDYPKMIYDGPFSEALKEKKPKFLMDKKEISEKEAKEKVKKYLHFDKLKSITLKTSNESQFETFLFEVKHENGATSSIGISKKGGILVFLNTFRNVTTPKLTDEECAELGKQYLAKIGLKNMESVWTNNNNSVVYVNYTPKINGVVIYPDLIKVKIASDNGQILGVECRNYIFNHIDRNVSDKVDKEECKQAVDTRLEIVDYRVALIPLEHNIEVLTVEFWCKKGNDTMLIYVDAKTFEEVNVLMMIDSNQGMLLM